MIIHSCIAESLVYKTNLSKINKILYDCLIEYNFYQPHRIFNLFTLIEYCRKLLNYKEVSMV